jgi:hypothetical protein
MFSGGSPATGQRGFHRGFTEFSTEFSRQGFGGFLGGFPWASPFCQKSRKTPGVICDLFAIFADVRVIPGLGLNPESSSPLPAPPALQGRCNLAFCWRCKPSGAAANVSIC